VALYLAVVEVLACPGQRVEGELEGVGVLGIEKLGDGDEVGYSARRPPRLLRHAQPDVLAVVVFDFCVREADAVAIDPTSEPTPAPFTSGCVFGHT